jgi:DNA-binding transcriptional LysR family regulator
MHAVNWDGVRLFLAVARTGRVSAAARRLGVEHTTISRRIAALEQELDTTLFYRTASGYRLTPVGQSVLANAEAMERAAIAVGTRARAAAGAVAGRVRLAMIPEIASHWFAPHLPAFRATHPAIDLEILVGTRPLDLSRGEADIAVRSPNPRQTGLVATRIAQSAVGLYASKAFLGTRRLRITDVESAHGLPLLVYLPAFAILQNAPWFRPILASAAIALETNSTHALLEAARASAGIAVLPRLVARGEPELVPVSDDVARSDVWLITHPEYRRDPKIRATADFLKQAAAGPKGLC